MATSTTVRPIYRSYGGENVKGRPDYYSKALCLASFLRAAEHASVVPLFLNDGPIDPDLVALMSRHGDVIQLSHRPLGMRASYRAAIEHPLKSGWGDSDVAYFCEDDYLHREEAFTALGEAAASIADASYFALYGGTPLHPVFGPGVDLRFPPGWRHHPDAVVSGSPWVNIPSTASTFGARVSALRADVAIIRQGMVPYRSRLLDHETCLVVQGQRPYTAGEVVLGPAATRFRRGPKALAANAVQAPFRLAFNLRSLSRRRRPHLMYAPDPNLACHLETTFMSPGVDWDAEAARAAEWAAEAGLRVPVRDSQVTASLPGPLQDDRQARRPGPSRPAGPQQVDHTWAGGLGNSDRCPARDDRGGSRNPRHRGSALAHTARDGIADLAVSRPSLPGPGGVGGVVPARGARGRLAVTRGTGHRRGTTATVPRPDEGARQFW